MTGNTLGGWHVVVVESGTPLAHAAVVGRCLAVGGRPSRVRVRRLVHGRHGFYERLGWERWRGPTFVRHGPELVRTEDEDDGVMVLRFDRSLAVDLSGSISCEARTGDDW